MENQQYEKWISAAEEQVVALESHELSAAERLRQALAIIDKVANDMITPVIADGFSDDNEEIYFFKRIKPRLHGMRLFENLLYRFAANIPNGTDDMIRDYYDKELLGAIRELQADGYHYRYYKTGAAEMDRQYFLQSGTGGEVPIIKLSEQVPGFSTPLDFTFARFIAYERLQDHILGLLAGSMYSARKPPASSNDKAQLKWTGESINLVELAYGIWLTGQLNNGNASITQILEWLESNFQVNIGLAYRRWFSISKRKRISVTKFIDQMKAAILKRLDDENGLR